MVIVCARGNLQKVRAEVEPLERCEEAEGREQRREGPCERRLGQVNLGHAPGEHPHAAPLGHVSLNLAHATGVRSGGSGGGEGGGWGWRRWCWR
jgi:hypothetical protein